MAIGIVLAMTLAMASETPKTTTPAEISTVNQTPAEIATSQQLRRLLDTYDVDRWIFQNRVLIEDGVIPHSSPVVTMRSGESDPQLLANYVHENIHWYVSANREAMQAAVAELREAYPDLPVNHPEGAGSAQSSYLHLVVCTLEYSALKEIVGQHRAEAIMRFWTTHHYTEIYRTVLRDETALLALLERHGLTNA